MLVHKDGQWVFVSKKTRRPLAYYKGEGKPSEDWVKKQEARIQFFKHGVSEAAYAGNIGIMELIKFKQKASDSQKKQFDQHVKNKKHKEAWDLVQHVTGVKLHKSIHEAISKDILPVAGAGQDGTDELRKKYQKDTPGQNVKTFTDYLKTK